MDKFKKEYVYDVEEYSQDVRRYQITSNVKLTYEEVISIYPETNLKNCLSFEEYVDWSDERFTDDEILNKIKIKGIFDGTEYGDDCQVDIIGDFEEVVDDD